ncbi:MAG: cell division protein FtsZ [Alphaproteobacteria bacterium]|nr:cell division protein FtsZ [Alphaproteobacteria bacterium]
MTINLKAPELRELKPRIMVCGVGGGGCNAVNNMITSGLSGVDFLVANTDAQALASSQAERVIQMGLQVTEGLGAGAQPEVGRAAAEEAREEIREHLSGAHMCFVTAGMGGGTGTGAAPVIAQIAREMGILTVGVVTKPFHFEGQRRLRIAESGISELQKCVDTLIVIPNQNLFRIATEKTTFADAFAMADQVLYSGVASVTDLMVKEGLINLDFADVRSIMRGMGKAMMGTGEATGENRANLAAEAAIANPLLDEVSMKGARGLLISITGGHDLTLYEVDEAASRIRQEVDEDANIILGATFDSTLEGVVRVSVVATGIDLSAITAEDPTSESRLAEAAERLRAQLQQARAQQSGAAFQAAPFARHLEEPQAPASYYAEQASGHGVYFEPAPPRLAYGEPQFDAERHEAPAVAYVPPAPEQLRSPRMPQIEDFPQPIQDQLRQQMGGGDHRRKSLFERLASFGASRQDDAIHGAPAAAAPRQQMAPAGQPSTTHAEYGKRPVAPASGGHAALDPHGRRAQQARSAEEDHLEIPAFLRRQANH